MSVALSGVAHAFVMLTTPAAARKPAVREQSFVEVSFEDTPDKRIEAEPPAAPELPPTPRAKVAGAAPRLKPEQAQAAAPAVSADLTKDAATRPAPADVKALNLMPKASSLATIACGMLDDRKAEACGASDIDPGADAGERALNESLSNAANRPAYRNQREPPKLVPAADGGYDYTARSDGWVRLFRAHIASDGTVQFEDGARLQLAPVPISGVFDIENTGQRDERHSAEKRWFLEQTAELRGRLANAARAAEDRRVRRLVESALERIRVSSTTPRAKRDAVIELWLGCGDTGPQRAMIEAWVREHMPQGSELGFSVDELATLGFDPYGPH